MYDIIVITRLFPLFTTSESRKPQRFPDVEGQPVKGCYLMHSIRTVGQSESCEGSLSLKEGSGGVGGDLEASWRQLWRRTRGDPEDLTCPTYLGDHEMAHC